MPRYKRLKRNGKNIDEHRWVWRQAHGEIPDGHEIHHKNGDGLDNRLANLELIGTSEHRSMHSRAASPRCSISGCEGKHEARGWCKKHWYRWRRNGHPLKLRGRGRAAT